MPATARDRSTTPSARTRDWETVRAIALWLLVVVLFVAFVAIYSTLPADVPAIVAP
jgi:hypothetical protein